MGANLKEGALSRAARLITSLKHIRDVFDKESGVPVATTVHSTRSEEDDIHKVVQSEKVLVVKAGREHTRFCKFPATLFKLNRAWIKQNMGKC